jgi:hypothetical protein
MKLSTRLLLFFLATGLPALAHAASYSFDFKTEKKKVEGNRTVTLERTVTDEKWSYTVTIQNHSFQDIANIDIKYIVYFKKETEGSKVAREKHKAGSTTVAVLQNNGSFTFDTDPILLVKSQLDGGFYYENGAKPRSRDSMTGIWVRLYQNGTMIGEYGDPPSLTNGKWEADIQ